MTNKITNILLILCLFTISANAEEHNDQELWHFTARAGYGIGGTVPLGFPEHMRALNSYSPKFNFRIGGDAERMLNDKFGVQAGLYVERKGFRSDVTMRQYDVILERGGERVTGPFTGNVVINIIQTGITIPVQGSWWINKHAKLAFGPYISFIVNRSFSGYAYGNKIYDAEGNWNGEYDAYLRRGEIRGEKIYIGNIETDATGATVDNRGTFDGEEFDNYLRKFQCGLDLDFDYYFNKHIGAFAGLSYGLNSAFTSDEGNPVSMGLHPLFFTFGIVYKFK